MNEEAARKTSRSKILYIFSAVFTVGIIALLFFAGCTSNPSDGPAGGHVKSVAEKGPSEDSSDSPRPAFADIQAGERFEFGSYPQGPNGEIKPITWLALRREGDSLLVVSEYGLDAEAYNEKLEKVTWEDCTLRRRLNGEFLQKAFTEQERSLIKTSVLANNAGPSTEDRIFLLSEEEADSLFSNDKDRRTKPTEYAVKNEASADESGYAWWWLRSRGSNATHAVLEEPDGDVSYRGNVDIGSVCVRPALRIAL